MADWFETRFRDLDAEEPLDPAFAARVRALVVEEWRSGASDQGLPRPDRIASGDTDPEDREGDIIVLDMEEKTAGGAPEPGPRRSRARWLSAAAAAVVIAVVAVVLTADDDEEIDTTTPTPTVQDAPAGSVQDVMDLPDFEDLEPGTYYIDPDGDAATPLRVFFDVAADGWSSWIGATRFSHDSHVALSITTVDNLVREGCNDHSPMEPAVGPTVDDLATALSQLTPFELSAPPSDVSVFGYRGKHLELTVPDLPINDPVREENGFSNCTDGELHSWIAENLDGAFWGYNGEPGRTEELWILDVEGTRLVLATTQAPESPPQDVEGMQDIFDSIRIVP